MFRSRLLTLLSAVTVALTAGTATAAPIAVQSFGGQFAVVQPTFPANTTFPVMTLNAGLVTSANIGAGAIPIVPTPFNIQPGQTVNFSAVTPAGGNVSFIPGTFALNAGADAYTFQFLGAGVTLPNNSVSFAPRISPAAGPGDVAGALEGFVRVTAAPANPTAPIPGSPGNTFNFGPVGTIYSLNQGFSVQGGGANTIQLVNGGYQIQPGASASTTLNSTFTFGRINADLPPPPAIPEPATIGTFAVLGLTGLVARRKMKKTVA